MPADSIPVSEATQGTLAPVGTYEVNGIHHPTAVLVDPSDPSRTVNVASDGSIGVREVRGSKTVGAVSVSDSATEVVAANADRKLVIIQNLGPATVYLGEDSSVTSSSGLELVKGGVLTDEHSTDAWYGITDSGTADLRVMVVSS